MDTCDILSVYMYHAIKTIYVNKWLLIWSVVLSLSLQLFNNEQHEADQYDKSLKQYEDAALKTVTSLSVLSFGQQLTFGVALTAIMLMASKGITQGNELSITQGHEFL